MNTKALIIRSNETEKEKQLGWWNISKIPEITDNVKYIFVHNGKGNITGAYTLSRITNWNDECVHPYAMLITTKGYERVNFYEFATNLSVDWFNIEIPQTKKGQANPLQIVDFDDVNRKIM